MLLLAGLPFSRSFILSAAPADRAESNMKKATNAQTSTLLSVAGIYCAALSTSGMTSLTQPTPSTPQNIE